MLNYFPITIFQDLSNSMPLTRNDVPTSSSTTASCVAAGTVNDLTTAQQFPSPPNVYAVSPDSDAAPDSVLDTIANDKNNKKNTMEAIGTALKCNGFMVQLPTAIDSTLKPSIVCVHKHVCEHQFWLHSSTAGKEQVVDSHG